jgi:hypothetical protein
MRALLGLAVLLAIPATAPAAPANDSRAGAETLAVPGRASATTADATTQPTDPPACASLAGTVFFRLGPVPAGPVVVRVQASGRLDAALAVYRQVRSQLRPAACDVTDDDGLARVRITAEPGAEYLVMVGRRTGSEPGPFTLDAFAPEPPEAPPGRRLPSGGARGSVDAVGDTADAWSVPLAAGRSYRIALTGRAGACVDAAVFRPGIRSFDAEPALRLGCDEYALYTPGPDEVGITPIQVTPDGARPGARPYRLRVRPAGPDDTTPGRVLPNLRTVRGALDFAAADAVDLYRFDVVRRSDVSLRLATTGTVEHDLLITSDRGREIRCACGLAGGTAVRQRLAPGRYYAAVRTAPGAPSSYRLTRLARTITATSLRLDGARRVTAAPGVAVAIAAAISPAPGGGRAEVTVERLDPLAGWQFLRRLTPRVGAGGVARASWTPPSLGRYRVRAAFTGTRTASPSRSGATAVLVAGPLIP